MAYSKALGKAVSKYDKAHYYKATVKIPLDIYEKMQDCKQYKNVNQFINTLILQELERDGLLDDKK